MVSFRKNYLDSTYYLNSTSFDYFVCIIGLATLYYLLIKECSQGIYHYSFLTKYLIIVMKAIHPLLENTKSLVKNLINYWNQSLIFQILSKKVLIQMELEIFQIFNILMLSWNFLSQISSFQVFVKGGGEEEMKVAEIFYLKWVKSLHNTLRRSQRSQYLKQSFISFDLKCQLMGCVDGGLIEQNLFNNFVQYFSNLNCLQKIIHYL